MKLTYQPTKLHHGAEGTLRPWKLIYRWRDKQVNHKLAWKDEGMIEHNVIDEIFTMVEPTKMIIVRALDGHKQPQ